jgi:hypothetical protein
MKRRTNRRNGKRVPLQKSVKGPVSVELVNKTRGLFPGKPSLSKALKRERRQKDRW